MLELTSTFGLSKEVDFFGDQFILTTNQAVLGKAQPYCRFATSRPDMMLYHITKYVSKDTLFGALVDDVVGSPMSTGPGSDSDETDEAPESPQSVNMITGLGTEDKLHGETGEPR